VNHGKGKNIYFDSAHDRETPSHELLHTLGLPHPFDGNSHNAKFTFEYCKTNNVMDYTHNVRKKRLSLYHWQWQIINIKTR
jgi:hypothetical protein